MAYSLGAGGSLLECFADTAWQQGGLFTLYKSWQPWKNSLGSKAVPRLLYCSSFQWCCLHSPFQKISSNLAHLAEPESLSLSQSRIDTALYVSEWTWHRALLLDRFGKIPQQNTWQNVVTLPRQLWSKFSQETHEFPFVHELMGENPRQSCYLTKAGRTDRWCRQLSTLKLKKTKHVCAKSINNVRGFLPKASSHKPRAEINNQEARKDITAPASSCSQAKRTSESNSAIHIPFTFRLLSQHQWPTDPLHVFDSCSIKATLLTCASSPSCSSRAAIPSNLVRSLKDWGVLRSSASQVNLESCRMNSRYSI